MITARRQPGCRVLEGDLISRMNPATNVSAASKPRISLLMPSIDRALVVASESFKALSVTAP